MSHLLSFYGRECPHCLAMAPIIEQVSKDTGEEIEHLEVWYDEKNAATMNEYDKNLCGGVPFFFNTDTKKWICGEATYEELKEWATGTDGANKK